MQTIKGMKIILRPVVMLNEHSLGRMNVVYMNRTYIMFLLASGCAICHAIVAEAKSNFCESTKRCPHEQEHEPNYIVEPNLYKSVQWKCYLLSIKVKWIQVTGWVLSRREKSDAPAEQNGMEEGDPPIGGWRWKMARMEKRSSAAAAAAVSFHWMHWGQQDEATCHANAY